MSFITESRKAYKQVQEAEDHEISMARGELEAIADKATQLASMLQGKSDEGNPLEAWVQSKITKAKDYINSVSDYMMYNPKINESYELEETTFEKIYQMQQDGKSAEDIAKELKLKPDLVKKVLGESKVISEGLSDAQIAQLKKEYEPLKGKTITTSQYQQLKNILFKLQDGDLEKLQKQNIPFASTGAGSILRVRKSPVKITNVTVPGLEGMAEGAKRYREMSNVGTAKYTVSFHDGIKKHNDGSDFFDMQIFKNKEEKNKFINDLEGKGYRPVKVGEEVKETFKDNIVKKLVKPIQDFNKKKEEPKKEEVELEEVIDLNDPKISFIRTSTTMLKKLARVAGIKPDTENNGHIAIYNYKDGKGFFKGQGKKSIEQIKDWIYKNGYNIDTKDLKDILKVQPYFESILGEEVEITETHFSMGQHVIFKGPKNPITPIKAQIIKLEPPYTGAYYQIKKADGETTYASADQLKLDEGNEVNNYIKSLKDSIQNLENKLSKLDKSKPDEEQKNLKDKIKLAKDNLDIMTKKQAIKQEEIENLQDACWTGYKQVGLKKKGKRMVPNCVPEERRLYIESIVAVKNKAEKSGMPYSILKQVYDRGMAAWKGGHRPGTTQVQWALARVNSFVTKSSGTWGGADSDLAKKVKG